MKIEFGRVVRLAAARLVPHEITDQRVFDREDGVAAEILVTPVENVRRDRLVAIG